jgi:hypothetical protein
MTWAYAKHSEPKEILQYKILLRMFSDLKIKLICHIGVISEICFHSTLHSPFHGLLPV